MQKGRVILADWRAERRRELSWRFGHPQIECVECANEADTLQSLESLPCDIVVIGSVGSRPFGKQAYWRKSGLGDRPVRRSS